MKKLIALTITLLIATIGLSQTQQGYVKTLGRPEKKGEALGGVTVRVKGEHNPVVSNQDGTFSLLLADKKNGDAYSLQQVKKSGYELNEKDIIGRQFAFSDKVPLTIVMVSTEQLQADKQRIENNAYKTAEKNYKAKYNLLEKQLSDNKITAEQYQKEIQDLQDKFEKYQSLIDGLAEHYVHTDYDELDEKDREINVCIENGELERADSLIQTLFDPIGVLERNMEALASIEQQIGQARGIINQANEDMAAVLKQQEKDAEYLYQLYTIALAKFDNNKAEFYIDTRAELDTTNGDWQDDAAFYYLQQNQFNKAQFYYNRAIRTYREKAQDDPETYEFYLATALNNIGEAYRNIMFYYPDAVEPCEKALSEAVEIMRRLADSDPLTYGSNYGGTITSLGNFYLGQKDLKKAKNAFEEAVNLQRRLVKEDDTDLEAYYGLAVALGNLGHVYDLKKDYKKGEKYLTESLEMYRQLAQDNPEHFEGLLAHALGILSDHYHDANEETKCEAAFDESVALYRQLAKDNPQRYEPQLADRLYGRGSILSIKYSVQLLLGIPLDDVKQEVQDPLAMLEEAKDLYGRYIAEPLYRSLYIDALKYLYLFYLTINEPQKLNQIVEEYCQNLAESKDPNQGAQEFIKLVQSESPETAGNDLFTAKSLMIMSENYRKSGLYNESEATGLESLEMFRKIAEVDPTHEIEVAMALNNFSILYEDTHQNDKREACLTEALDICRRVAKTDPENSNPILAKVLANLGKLYKNTERYNESEAMYKECVQLRRQLVKIDKKANESGLASTLGNYGDLFLNDTLNRYEEGIPLVQEAYEIYQRLARSNHEQYESDLVTARYVLSWLYLKAKRHIEGTDLLLNLLETCHHSTNSAITQMYNTIVVDLKEWASYFVQEAIDYKNEKQYKESETYYQKTLDIYKRLAKDDPKTYEPEVATILNDLGILYHDTQRIEDCEKCYKEALKIKRRIAKEGTDDLAITLNNLGYLYLDNKQYQESETYYLEAVEIYRRIAKQDLLKYGPRLAITLENLGLVYKNTQRYSEYEETYLESVEVCRQLAQANPEQYEPWLASSLHELGRLYDNANRYEESEAAYLEALEIRRKLAKQDPEKYEFKLAQTLNNIAFLYKNAHRYTESETYYLEAMEIFRRLVQQNQQVYEPNIPMVLLNTGEVLLLDKKYQEAIPYLEEAMTLSKKYADNNATQQRRYENALNYLSTAYANTGDHQRSYELKKTYLSLLKTHYQEQPDNYRNSYVNTLGGQSFQCLFIGHNKEAEQLAREAIAIDASQHWLFTNLAAALLFQGKYEEAEKVYLQYKNELKDSFLQDFNEFETAGIIPEECKADVERIKQILSE